MYTQYKRDNSIFQDNIVLQAPYVSCATKCILSSDVYTN